MNFNIVDVDSIRQKIENAPTEQKAEVIASSIAEFVDQKYSGMIEQYQSEYRELQANNSEESKFGLRNLSNEETQFYNKLVNQELKSGLSGEDTVLLPVKTVNYVFEDLKLNHPLFQHLDFVPAGVEEWFISEKSGKGTWGRITSAITAELEAEIKKFNTDVHMVSAFMYIPLGILDLGHKWIDKFVRTILGEALEEALEEGYVNGDGKESPIGAVRDLEAPVVAGAYAKKTAVAITDFGVDSFNKDVLPTLNRNGKRIVNKIIVLANQNDIDTGIFKATHVLGATGFVKANLPKEFIFVPSIAMKAGEALAMLPKKYLAGVTRLGIDTSKDYKFLERLQAYAIVGYGNGRAKANDDIVLLDITGLKPLVPTVNVTTEATDSTEDDGEGA